MKLSAKNNSATAENVLVNQAWLKGTIRVTTVEGGNLLGVSQLFAVYNSTAGESAANVESLPTTAPPRRPIPSTKRSQASSSTSASTGPGSTGLSTGAEARIGVDVALGVITVLALCFCLWRRRKRSHNNATATVAAAVNYKRLSRTYRKPELAGDSGSARFHYGGKPELAVERDRGRLGHSTSTSPETVNQVEDAAEDPATPSSASAPRHQHERESLERRTIKKELADPSNPITQPAVGATTPAPRTPQKEDAAPKYAIAVATDRSEMRAQEPQLRDEIQAHEDLQRLRDEHAALVERIRLAEMRTRNTSRG